MTTRRACGGVYAICLYLVVCAAACSPGPRHLSLAQSVQVFNDAMRWSRYHEAAGFVVPMDRATFLREQEELGESRRIMEYRVQEISQVDEKTAAAIVRWKYTHVNSPVVIKERIVQTWTEVGDDWFFLRMELMEEKKEKAVRGRSGITPR